MVPQVTRGPSGPQHVTLEDDPDLSSAPIPFPGLIAQTGRRSLQGRTSREPNSGITTTIKAVKNNEVPAVQKIVGSGSLLNAPDENIYHYESIVRRNGQRYKFVLDIAVNQPVVSMTTEEKATLNRILEKERDIFLKTTDRKGNFNFIFTADGYTTFVPNKDKEDTFDPQEDSIQAGIDSGYIADSVSVDSEAAIALSDAIAQLRIGNGSLQENMGRMESVLDSNKVLKTYQTSAQSESASSPQTNPPSAPPSNPLTREEKTPGGNTTVSVTVGDITQQTGTLVNFTNATLDQKTQIFNASGEELKEEIKNIRTKHRKLIINPEGVFKPGEIVSTKEGKILHAVIDPSKPITELVHAALSAAHKNKDTHIAFTLPENTPEQMIVYDVMINAIRDYAKKHENDIHHFEEIKIVLTEEQWNACGLQSPTPAPQETPSHTESAPPVAPSPPAQPQQNSVFTIKHQSNDPPKKPGRLEQARNTISGVFKKPEEVPLLENAIQKTLNTAGAKVFDFRSGKEFDPAKYGKTPKSAFEIFRSEMLNFSMNKPLTGIKLIVPDELQSEAKKLENFFANELAELSGKPYLEGNRLHFVNDNLCVEGTFEEEQNEIDPLSNEEKIALKQDFITTFNVINNTAANPFAKELILNFTNDNGLSTDNPVHRVFDYYTKYAGAPPEEVFEVFLEARNSMENHRSIPIRFIFPQDMLHGQRTSTQKVLEDIAKTVPDSIEPALPPAVPIAETLPPIPTSPKKTDDDDDELEPGSLVPRSMTGAIASSIAHWWNGKKTSTPLA